MPQVPLQLLTGLIFIQALISYLFCSTLYKALKEVRQTNRTINAGLVWLLMIPVFDKIWNFKVFTGVASSLNKEFTDRNYEIEARPGFVWGMTYATLSILTVVLLSISPQLELVAGLLSMIGMISFVQYWVKINWYRKVLEDETKGLANPESE